LVTVFQKFDIIINNVFNIDFWVIINGVLLVGIVSEGVNRVTGLSLSDVLLILFVPNLQVLEALLSLVSLSVSTFDGDLRADWLFTNLQDSPFVDGTTSSELPLPGVFLTHSQLDDAGSHHSVSTVAVLQYLNNEGNPPKGGVLPHLIKVL